MPGPEQIEFSFKGGHADSGRLHYYEFGRSQYALARLVNTIEYFRREGRVAERIVGNTYVDVFVKAPREGSFVTEILVPILIGAAGNVTAGTFNMFFAYVWDLMTPKAVENEDALRTIAEIRKDELERDKFLAQQQTAQIEAMARVMEGGQQTAQMALQILNSALQSGNPRLQSALEEIGNVNQKIHQLEADVQRERMIYDHEKEFSKLDPDDLQRLTSRIRPMVPDIGLPLRRSATSLTVRNVANDNMIVSLDENRIRAIAARHLSEDEEKIEGVVRMYDRFSGLGKFRSHHFLRDLNFKVPPELRQNLLPKILDAMRKQEVSCKFRVIKDESDQPTSLILLDVFI